MIQGGIVTRNIIATVKDNNLLSNDFLVAFLHAINNKSAKETYQTNEVTRIDESSASVDIPFGMPSGVYRLCLEQGGRASVECQELTIVKTMVE